MLVRCRIVIGVLSLAAAVAGHAQAAGAPKEPSFENVKGSEWVRVTAHRQGFEATFPGRPAFDERSPVCTFKHAGCNADFEAVWQNFGPPLKKLEGNAQALNRFYDTFEGSILRNKQAVLESSKNVVHEGRPARRVEWRQPVPGDPRLGYALIVAVGDTLYLTSVNQPAIATVKDATIDRFLGSLKPLAKRPEPKAGAEQPDPAPAKQPEKADLVALMDKMAGKWKGARYLVGGAFEDRVNDEWWIIRPNGTYEATKFIVTTRVTEQGKWRLVDGKTLELIPIKNGKEQKPRPCTFTLGNRSLTIRHSGSNEEVRLRFSAPAALAPPKAGLEQGKGAGPNPLQQAKIGDWAKYDLLMDGETLSRATYSVTGQDGKQAGVQLASESVRTRKITTSSQTVDVMAAYPVVLLAGYRQEQKIDFTKIRSEAEAIKVAGREFNATRTEYTFRQRDNGLTGTATIWTASDGPFGTLLKREVVVNGILTVRFSAILTAFGANDK